MKNEFEEEDEKLERFKRLITDLDKDPDLEQVGLAEFLEDQKRHDEQLNHFIESYRSGDSQVTFLTLDDLEQKTHIHLLEIAMIITRQKGNMMNYYEMKKIVDRLKQINEGS